jgi:CheY-like chemotaxis protein
MIVDDCDEIRRMLRLVVCGVADPIYERRDGGAARAAYATHRPDCVLMDVSMTPMDGITATRQGRFRRFGRLSGFAGRSSARQEVPALRVRRVGPDLANQAPPDESQQTGSGRSRRQPDCIGDFARQVTASVAKDT